MNENICRTCLTTDRQSISLQKIQLLLQQIKLVEIGNIGNVCWECYSAMRKFSKFKLQILVAQDAFSCKLTAPKSLSVLTMKSQLIYDYKFYHDADPLTVKTEHEMKEEDSVSKSNERSENDTVSLPKNVKIAELGERFNYVNVKTNSKHVEHERQCRRNSESEDNESTFHDVEYSVPITNDIRDVNVESSLYYSITKGDSNNIDYDSQFRIQESHLEYSLSDEFSMVNEIEKMNKDEMKIKRKTARTQKNFSFNDIKQNGDDKELLKKFAKVILSVEEMQKHREEKRNQPNFKKLPYKCNTCVLGFTREEKFQSHMTKAHSENKNGYICDVCDTRYPKKRRLERHCRKHFECYKCRLCKFETVELWSIYNHCQHKHSIDNVDNIHCPQCLSVFKNPDELAEHTRTEHILNCNECGEKFKSKNTLRSHILRMHKVKREFACEICRKTFKTRSRLESHAATHSSALAQKLAYCALCRVQYKNLHVYRNHVRNSAAHSRDTYSCPVCNKKFVSKVYWTSHYNFYHLNKFQYMCEICNKPFISDWRLKNHRQKHHGYSRTRDHTCNVCGKKFYTSSTLRAHQLIHSEERSYMCEDCGDTFKQRAALYTHSRLVHKGVKRKKTRNDICK